MDNNEITNILNSFTGCPHSFKINDLIDICENPIDFKSFDSAITSDSRFIQLSSPESDERYFISKRILIQWFVNLNIRLCKIRQFNLTKRQLALTLSHLRIEGQWDSPPVEAVQLAKSLNFILLRPISDSFAFPIAKILSFIEPSYIDSVCSFLHSIYEKNMSKRDLEILGNNFLKASFSKSNKRTAKILKLRGDLGGTKRLTLKEISKRLGITRERVRQIERTWLNQHGSSFSVVFICDFIIEEGNLATRLDLPRARLRKVLSKHIGIPFVELSDIGLLILGIRPKEAKFITQLFNDWKSNISTSAIAKSLEEQEKIFLTDIDIKTISICLAQAIYKHLNHSQKVYLVLRSIGKPAHYSRVAEACNDLFPETQISERSVHAILCREEHNIIWIGVRGTYALKEWGYSRPSKTLFNTVTEIVNKFYRQTKKPVSYEMIIIEMSKYRKAYNPYSIFCATYRNPKLEAVGDNFFTPKHSSPIVQDKTSEEKLHSILENFQSKLNV